MYKSKTYIAQSVLYYHKYALFMHDGTQYVRRNISGKYWVKAIFVYSNLEPAILKVKVQI